MTEHDIVDKINALAIPVTTKYELFEQYEADCEAYSQATALEKLATGISDAVDAQP